MSALFKDNDPSAPRAGHQSTNKEPKTQSIVGTNFCNDTKLCICYWMDLGIVRIVKPNSHNNCNQTVIHAFLVWYPVYLYHIMSFDLQIIFSLTNIR